MTARAYKRLFAFNLGLLAYWWGLIAYIAVNAGEEGSVWPFVGVPLALLAQARLWRTLREDARSNQALSPTKRGHWEMRLRLWAPVASLGYLWVSVRRTAR